VGDAAFDFPVFLQEKKKILLLNFVCVGEDSLLFNLDRKS
jgi:hypothetical protein